MWKYSLWPSPYELRHRMYASPYYDPVKAHEYYEQHKQLKGRSSTSGLNSAGREAAKYVKKRLNEERTLLVGKHKDATVQRKNLNTEKTKTYIESLRDQKKKDIEANTKQTKQQIDSHKSRMTSEIDSLRQHLKGLSKEQKAAEKEKIMAKILRLKDENKAFRENLQGSLKNKRTELNETFSSVSAGARGQKKEKNKNLSENHKKYKAELKDKYDRAYESEVAKIKSDESMLKKTKNKKGG